ncbi:MAG: TlpA family protein disulfide reductase [Sphingobacteriaceae bacterium]|nr:MAG: TlpA family protein disulfide reductase [Sphingobacteriaceae bacterium]
MGEHISAEPESLQAMRQLYKKNFPDEDFTTIMFSEVISKWAPAPDFKLKDHFNKQSFTLNDYLGKWMVIDFWGTWCGPCVAEMPGTNVFYKELVENKYANAAFLSIACKDYLESVQPFMKKNNYDFPVLMSDGKIQSKYKVDGYPYKVLVSPNGRMIPLQSGRNWQDIIKEFSAMVLVN